MISIEKNGHYEILDIHKFAGITTSEGNYSYSYLPGTGQLASISTPENNVLSFSYDGMLAINKTWTGAINGSIAQTFDNNFRVVSRSINGSHTINFQYDNDDLLIGSGALLLTPRADNGLLEDTQLGTISSHYDYNIFAELANFKASYTNPTSLNNSILYAVNYGTRDALGRIVDMSETIEGNTINWHYDYDLAGRLEKVTQNGVLISHYGFDDNGNRLTVNGITVGVYDDQDRLESYNNTDYSYNDNGDLISKTDTSTSETTHYDYDVFGNLRQVELPNGNQIDYVIDGLDRRIAKKVNGTMVQGFLYKDTLNPAAELDSAGNVVSRFVYANKGNVPAYMIKGGVNYRILSDHLGSPRLVVNTTTGDIVQRMDFDEYGNITQDTNPGFQPFGFAGGIYDEDTGLVRFGARDYDAVTGRWTAKDPIGFEGGLNTYAYVGSNPLYWIDPYGLFEVHGYQNRGGGRGWKTEFEIRFDPLGDTPNKIIEKIAKTGNRIKKFIDILDTEPSGPNHPYKDYLECGKLDNKLDKEYEDYFGDQLRLNYDDALEFLNDMNKKYPDMKNLYPTPKEMLGEAEVNSKEHWFYKMSPDK